MCFLLRTNLFYVVFPLVRGMLGCDGFRFSGIVVGLGFRSCWIKGRMSLRWEVKKGII